MRKAQKKQAEDFVELLGQAHDEIRKAIETGNIVLAMDLLGQCQEGAIQLGDLIEKTEEDSRVIPLLESYCELIYQFHEELAQGNSVNANKVYKKLRKALFQIESGVRNDIKLRREVVFLPYKASMWDSLESIWKAADEDPDCDAYVIPIPYYDKNPDGSFRERHYEGDQYPEYVPVTWYEEYDFEKRQPDMIYIHNPYDNNNYVTSVDPNFYSSELKKYTDKLVYVPYFILGEIDPNDEKALEGLEKFCAVPAVINADKVIVQSEAMRQAYVNVMTRLMAEYGYKRKYWEDKILGLGSPKVDKVLNTRKEDLEIPEEWMKVIRKPDGSWKKIVFYNTSVTTLLQHNEKYLEKMRDVFRVFYENREEVALLWRPHPLMAATLESMRPQLWEEYRRIVEQYREDGWGIYDDTADMDRAVCLSDGYYGDWSSVVWLYQEIEKPVMLQDVQFVGTQGITMTDAVRTENKVWFCPMNFNSLLAMDISDGKIIQKYDIPSVRGYGMDRSFGSMVRVGRKIYLVPFYERSIIQFEIDSKKFTSIELDEELVKNKNGLFMGSRVYDGQYIFFMGAYVPAIIRLDTTDNSIKYICDWYEKVEKLIFDQDEIYFRKQCVFKDNSLFVPFCNANAVLEVNCKTLETVVWKLGDEKEGYSGICLSGESMWISPRRGGKLIKWHPKRREVCRFDIPGHKKENLYYIGIVNLQGKIILVSSSEKGPSFKIESENVYEADGNYNFMQENENELILYEKTTGKLMLWDDSRNIKKILKVVVEREDIDINRFYKENVKPFTECDEVNALQLFEFIGQEKTEECWIRQIDNNTNIYKIMEQE